MNEMNTKEIYQDFAELLSYPQNTTYDTARSCHEKLVGSYPQAAEKLRRFVDFSKNHTSDRMEEIYTASFDLQPTCYPYVGYQLCGENQKRALFLMKIQQIYRGQNFQTSHELPDHLSEVLRFVGTTEDQQCCRDLIDDGIVPALEKILAGFDSDDHAYRQVLDALMIFLGGSSQGKGEAS